MPLANSGSRMPASPVRAGGSRAPRSRRFVLLLFGVATVALLLVVRPYAGAFFAAAVFATVLFPLQQRTARRFGARPRLAAATLTAGLVLVVLAPLGFVTTLAVRQALDLYAWASDAYARSGTDGLVEPLPFALRDPARKLVRALPLEALDGSPPPSDRPRGALEEPGDARPVDAILARQAPEETADASPVPMGAAARRVGHALARTLHLLVRTGLFVLALFFCLSEGRKLVDYFVELVPLEPARTRELLSSFRGVSVGVFLSTLATAGAQALAALVGYLIAGVPLLPLVFAATFVLAFVPAVGGATVTVGAGLVLWASGETGKGIFLVIWGVVCVGLVDNVVKPWVAKGRAHLPGSLVFFAMICGLAVFGPMGLVAGPMVVALFQVSARLLREDRAAWPSGA